MSASREAHVHRFCVRAVSVHLCVVKDLKSHRNMRRLRDWIMLHCKNIIWLCTHACLMHYGQIPARPMCIEVDLTALAIMPIERSYGETRCTAG